MHPALPAEAAPATLTLEGLPPDVLENLTKRCGMNRAELSHIVDAVNSGVSSVGEYLGLSDTAANGIEGLALAYYRHGRYDLAEPIYNFLVQLFPHRLSAWRGLGAVGQARKNYLLAITAYLMALVVDPQDIASQALLGEAYLLSGRRDNGMGALQLALELPPRQPHDDIYIKRAQVLLEAQRRRPASEPGGAATPGAPAAAAADAEPASEAESEAAGDDPDDFIAAEAERQRRQQQMRRQAFSHIDGSAEALAVLERPDVAAMMEQIKGAVMDGSLPVKEVAGVTEGQLQAGYVVACAYLEQGRPMQCLQVLATLLYLDCNNPTYLQLAGLTAHHMKLYCLADYYYSLALIQDGSDPRTLIYAGEAKILSEERDAGLELINKGIALGSRQADLKDMIQRGKLLLKQFSTAPKTTAEGAK